MPLAVVNVRILLCIRIMEYYSFHASIYIAYIASSSEHPVGVQQHPSLAPRRCFHSTLP